MIVWKHKLALLLLQLELEISGVAVHETNQNSKKMTVFSDYFLRSDGPRAIIAIFVVWQY